MRLAFVPFVLLAACDSKVELGDSIADASDVERLCAEETPQQTTLLVQFEGYYDGCAWGEDGNLEMEDGYSTARHEETEALGLGADTVICDVDYNFQVDPDRTQIMRYDDHFFFTFDDVVLAASYAPMVDEFALSDGLPVYDWDAIAGYDFAFDNTIPTYCLGEADGLATCTIPPSDTPGEMALDFDASIASRLSFRAIEEGRVDFSFITLGDNDPATDCSHDAFDFEVSVSYLQP